MQNLYDIKFRIFLKVMNKDMNKWKVSPYHKIVNSCQVSL